MVNGSHRPADASLVDTLDRRLAETGEISDDTLELPRSESAPQASAVLRCGDRFAGRFEILGAAGRGGFSLVYRAKEIATGEIVALKFLASQEGGKSVVDRMQRELRLSRDLVHPNIVRVYDLLNEEGFLCLSMEFVEGPTLKELIHDRHPLALDHARRYLLKLTSAMAAVHAAGIVHRDLKPQNVIVTLADEVKVLDFGLAKTPDSTGLTATGTILGTPEYMAPEQVEGKVADARSDVYALGVIGYELLTGQPPFRGDNALATALQHVRSRVPDPRALRPELAEELSRFILKLADRDPARRPATAQDALVQLSQLVAGGASATRRRRGLRKTVAAAVVAVLSAWGVLVLRRPTSTDPFADGVVHVAVAGSVTAEVSGGGSFVAYLVNDLPARLSSARVKVHAIDPARQRAVAENPAELRGGEVEHVVKLALTKVGEGESASFRLDADVIDVHDGHVFAKLTGVPFRALDFEAVDGVSRQLATQYLAAVEARLPRR